MNEDIVRYEEIYQTMVSLDIKYSKANNLDIEYAKFNDYSFVQGIIPKEIFEKIIKSKINRSHKRSRYKSKLHRLYELQMSIERDMGLITKIVFITMTLDDKSLNQKEETRVKKINKWLKKHFCYAIVNKDFGKKTEREHYHAIGITYEPIVDTGKKSHKGFSLYELKFKDYQCGFEPNLLIINPKDNEKMNSYLLKLNNHSNKDTTKTSRVRIISKKRYKSFMDMKK